jgi:hypothetical protein
MKRVVKIEWNKAGEAAGTRQIVLEVPVPVVGRETNPLEDAILQLPMRSGGYDEKCEETAGQDFGDVGSPEVVWYVTAGERFSAPEPAEVLFLLREEPARRAAGAQAKRESREREEKERRDRQAAELEQELRVPPAERQGQGTYPVALFVPPGMPKELVVRAEEYRVELAMVLGVNRARERADREKIQQEKEARAQRRREYIAGWAAIQGSARLQAQVAAGMEGWPLYLHERLAADLGPDAELDNDGSDPEPLINPTFEQMVAAADLASRLLACGQVEKGEVAIRKVTVAKITFAPDEDDPYPVVLTYTCCDWTPGDPELFEVHSVRVACVD